MYNIVYKNYTTYMVLGTSVNLLSEELDIGRNTIAEVGNSYHYLGPKLLNISSAIFVYQNIFKREITNEEFSQIMIDNNLISGAV